MPNQNQKLTSIRTRLRMERPPFHSGLGGQSISSVSRLVQEQNTRAYTGHAWLIQLNVLATTLQVSMTAINRFPNSWRYVLTFFARVSLAFQTLGVQKPNRVFTRVINLPCPTDSISVSPQVGEDGDARMLRKCFEGLHGFRAIPTPKLATCRPQSGSWLGMAGSTT